MEAINRFDHIEHMPLRVYNRVVMMHNVLEDFGEAAMKEYINAFSDDERKQMFIMNTYLGKFGKKSTLDFVTKGLNIQYNVSEEENVSG